MHKLAYPANYTQHVETNHGVLKEAYHHGGDDILDLNLRGEYLYTANGAGGFEVFDVANIDQKGFSERIVTAPVSPLGQRTCVATKFATSVALPPRLRWTPPAPICRKTKSSPSIRFTPVFMSPTARKA